MKQKNETITDDIFLSTVQECMVGIHPAEVLDFKHII